MKSFNGNRLKLARQYRGLTVEELSQRLNVNITVNNTDGYSLVEAIVGVKEEI